MVPEPFERKLTAILYADVAEYSRLTGEDEEGTHRLLGARLDALTAAVHAHSGKVVHFAGDAVLAAFGSVVDALTCAAEVQREIAAENAALPEQRQVQFRVGVNIGDVIVDRNDIYGDGVNVAARLQTLAEPGGVCISGAVHDIVGARLPFSYEFLGGKSVKNIASPVPAYRVVLDVGVVSSRTQQLEASARPSMVVLPFINFSRDEEQEYFCDGLTNDITIDLSRFSNLFVIATNSAFTYKGKQVKTRDVCTELGVEYALQGTVQRTKNRVRVNVQLVEASTDHQLWAQRFNRDIDDLFAVQDEMVQTIVAALAVRVDTVERNRVIRKEPRNINAYEALLRGLHMSRFLWESEDADEEGYEWLRRATELDPSYARAWAELSYHIVLSWTLGRRDNDALEQAKDHAQKAVLLDPDDHDTHWGLAFYYRNTGEFDHALSEYIRALELNRNDADLLAELSDLYVAVGMHEEGLETIDRALRLNPYAPDWYRWNKAWAYYFHQEYDKAVAEIDRMVRHHGHDALLRAACHARRAEQLGGEEQTAQRAKSAAALSRVLEQNPDWTVAKERRVTSFKKDRNRAHWIEGVRLAGLPEGDT